MGGLGGRLPGRYQVPALDEAKAGVNAPRPGNAPGSPDPYAPGSEWTAGAGTDAQTIDQLEKERRQAINRTSAQRKNMATTMFEDWVNARFGGALMQVGPDVVDERTGVSYAGTTAAKGVPIRGRDSTGSDMERLIMAMGKLDSAGISRIQRMLFQGGFYPGSAYTKSADIQWGLWDPISQDALGMALEMAATNNVTNFDTFLEEQRIRFAREGTTADARNVAAELGVSESNARTVDIQLTDPDSVRLMAETSARELLGRKPTEAELNKITASLHARQRDYQTGLADVESRMAQAEMGGDGASDNLALLRAEKDFDLTPSGNGGPNLNQSQADIVQTIIDVAGRMGLGDEYVVAAITAGIVESGLTNTTKGLPNKKGDYSIGVFQQHGHYGTKEQRLNVAWSTQKFFEEALRYDGSTIGEWVANTQRPAKQFRGRYDEVLDDALGIFTTHTGRSAQARAAAGAAAGRVGGGAVSIRQAEAAGAKARVIVPPTREERARDAGRVSGRPGAVSIRQAEAAAGTQSSGRTLASRTGVEKEDRADAHLWLNSVLNNSMADPIFRESMVVNPQDHIDMELRRSDPKAYETRQAALRAIDFMSMLGAGGGMVSG